MGVELECFAYRGGRKVELWLIDPLFEEVMFEEELK